MKRILVLHTGGTISMEADASGTVAPSLVNPMTAVTFPLSEVEVVAREPFHLPSPHVTVADMLQLYREIKAEADAFDGFVITHGTDTLEETAYFLDTMAIPQKPIVLTGAMRSSNELGSDGVYNYLTALRVAADDKSADKGVLVVMNDEVHATKYVTKTHTTNISTFQTPTHGPLGLVTKQEILYFKQAEERVRFDMETISGCVPILTTYAGMDSLLLEKLVDAGIDGLVIEAMGAGNLPPILLPSLEQLVARGIPIVLVSRCFNGIAEPVYGYLGGGADLQKKGVFYLKKHFKKAQKDASCAILKLNFFKD